MYFIVLELQDMPVQTEDATFTTTSSKLKYQYSNQEQKTLLSEESLCELCGEKLYETKKICDRCRKTLKAASKNMFKWMLYVKESK